MKTLTLSLVILIGSSCLLYGQKEASNWYFGNKAGITFNYGAPTALTNSTIYQSEGNATISDANGNLLFYTDGHTIYASNHTVMANGNSLNGDNQSAQSAVIVPMPLNPDLYYVFTVSNWPLTGSAAGLFYSVVDMRLNGGLGGVTTLNVPLNLNIREQVSAAYHDNCRDIWIVSHEKGGANNNYVSYLLTPTGVNGTPVVSPVGMFYGGGNRYGYLRFSPNGKKMCSTLGYAVTGSSTISTVELYDFDKATGVVSNPIQLADVTAMRDAYSSEFSADNSKLYVCTYNSGSLLQYDLSSGVPATIKGSAITLTTPGTETKSCLQMGPDKKIYVSKYARPYLGVINDPNQRGAACNYIDNAVDLGTGVALLGLPNFLPGFFSKPNLGVDRGICTGTTMLLDAYTQPGETYLWQDGSTGSNFTVSTPGTYWVEVTNGSCVKRDEVTITVRTPPSVSLGPDKDKCPAAIETLDVTVPGATYLWQDGTTLPVYDVAAPGTYWVTVDLFGCTTADTITIGTTPAPTVNLGNDTTICMGDTLFVDAGFVAGYTYKWTYGGTGHDTIITTNGLYWVAVSNSGCTVSDSIRVTSNARPTINLGADIDLCSVAPSKVLDGTNSSLTATYLWQDGSTNPTYTASQAGDYWVKVTDKGCSRSDTITLGIVSPPLLELGNDTTVCNGANLLLNAYTAPGNAYIWPDGSFDSVLTVNTAGKYWVDVFNTGCWVSDTINIVFAQPPTVQLGNDTTLCEPVSFLLNGSVTGTTAQYHWNNGSTGSSVMVVAAGKYWVDVKDNGCNGTDTINITSVTPPLLNLGNDTTLCSGSMLTLNALTAPGYNYTWQDGSASATFQTDMPGRYYVDVTNGVCKVTDTIFVTSISAPVVRLGNDTVICTNGTVLLTSALPYNNPAYTWQDGSSAASYTATQPGLYWLAVNESGCIGKDSVMVTAMPLVDIGSDTVICINHALTLQPVSIAGASYRWQDGSTSPTFQVTGAGTYKVDVTTSCGILSDDIIVKTNDCNCRINIPNAFSPDRNWHNDVFKPVISHCNFAEYNMKIFNRWGERVFETNDPQKGWDGVFKGKNSDIGAYVYIVTYRSTIASDTTVKRGTLILVR